MNDEPYQNKWRRNYADGEGAVRQTGPTSFVGDFTPYQPTTGSGRPARGELRNLDDAKAAVDGLAGTPRGEWTADSQNV